MNPSGIGANEDPANRSSGRPRLTLLQRYGLAALSVGAALGLSLLLQHFHFRVPAAVLLFAVAISSWYAGRGPGVLAAILSIISIYWYFVEPVRTIYIYWSEIPYFIILTAFAVLLSWFGTVRRRIEEDLRQLNRKLQAVSNCNQALLRATDEQSLLERICRIVCEQAGYPMAFVAYAEHDEAKSVRPVAWTGTEEGYLASVGLTWADTERRRGPTGTAIRTGQRCCVQDIATDPRVAPWREALLQRGFRSAIALPLKDEQGIPFGSLTICSAQPSAFTPAEITLLEELAGDLAYGITALRMRAERQKADEALRTNEARYRTAEAVGRVGNWEYNVRAERYWGSDEAKRMFGFDPGQADFTIDEVEGCISERERVHQALVDLIEAGKPYDLDFELRPRGSKEVRIISSVAQLLRDEQGNALKVVGSIRDITESKHAEHSIALLSSAMNKVRDATFLSDANGRFHYVNEEACQALGYTRAELLGMTVPDIDLQVPAERWPELWLELKTQKALTFESCHRTRDGRIYPVEIRGNYFEYGGGAYCLALVRDITERKRAEEALRQSEAYLTEAQSLTHTGSWAFDVASGTYTYASEEDYRIWGFDPREGSPREEAVLQRVHPDDRNKWKAGFEKPLREKVDSSDEYRIVLPDGTIKHIYAIRHPVLNQTGDVVRLVGSTADITERKRAQEALRLANAYNRGLIEASVDPLVTIGPDGKITDVNAATESATGRSRSELIGTDFCDYFTEPANARAGYEQAFREGLVRDYRLDLRHRDGNVMSVSYNAAVYRDEWGKVVGVLAAARDITERKRVEEALRRNAAYLAEAQRLIHVGTFVADNTTKPLYWSEEVFRIFGFDPKDGLPTREQPLLRIHPQDVDKFGQAWQRAINDKLDADVEYRTVFPDGTVKHVHGVATPILNGKGDVVELVGVTVDITERKRAEEALRRSEAYLAEAQRLTRTGAWATDGAPKPLYWSEELFRLYGLDPKDGVPTHELAMQRVHPEDRDKYAEAFRRVIREKVDSDVEFRTVLPDGAIKHLYGLGHPVLNADGELVEVVGTTVDITERKRSEEALRESETRFRTFVDHAADAFFMLDFEQRIIIDANQAACDSLGYTRQELIGQTPLAFHLDSYSAEMKLLAERAVTGESVFDRHWHRRKDGSLFPVEVHTNLISYDGHRFLLKVARDISDRVRVEEQREKLRRLEAEIAHLDRLTTLGELTASIAHEVNQPLSGVVSNGSACLRWLAGETPNLEEAREASRRIVRDGKRAAEVISRIRAMTKKATENREKLDLNETIREVLALVGDEAKKNGVVIRTEFAGEVFPVVGDRVQLQQVVLNLVMNGIEAMSSVGEKKRELLIATRNADSNQVQVTVRDSGIGLDPEAMPKIFEPFYTTKTHGMGMGLSITRSILQAHGGQLWAAANEGPGTSFHFTLPRCEEKSHAAA